MFIESLISFILRRRLLVVLLVLFFSSLAVLYVPRVTFDSSIDVWFLKDDPNLKTYHKFLDRFGADEIVVMGVFADDIFSPEVLASINRMTALAEKAPHVHRVRSITNIKVPFETGDGVAISNLVPDEVRDCLGHDVNATNCPMRRGDGAGFFKVMRSLKQKALSYRVIEPFLSR
ncbi:MAG: hypothetical protein HQM16_09175, partial [Deltaproteobacteria bacterium]|nr:hypothetical protein [Deltaproteobacteria bacterium]